MKREQKRSKCGGNLFMFQNIAWTHVSVLYNEKVSCQISVWLKLILGDPLWMSSNIWIFNSYFKYTGRDTLQESSKNDRKEMKSSVCTGNYLDIQVFAAGCIVLSSRSLQVPCIAGSACLEVLGEQNGHSELNIAF